MVALACQPDARTGAAEHAVASAAVVRAEGLGRRIDDRAVLEDLTFALPPGQCVALVGPNGAGKSSLLSVLATLTPPTSGRLLLFGQSVGRGAAGLRARIGLVGHQPMLYRDLTAIENLVFFGRLYGLSDPEDRAEQLLEDVALLDRADDLARTFSRGMIQRLAIARALLHQPDLLLADEPFTGLDLPSTRMLEDLFRGLARSGRTIVLANHDLPQTLALAQRVLVLRAGRLVLDQPAADLSAGALSREVLRP